MAKWIMKIPVIVSTLDVQLTEKQKDKVLEAIKEKKTHAEIEKNTYISVDFVSLQRVDLDKIN